MTLLDQLQTTFEQDVTLVHQLLHGDATEHIVTDGGSIPTFAKAIDIVINGLNATSSTSHELTLGEKAFTVQSGKYFKAGQWLIATTESGSLVGTVVSYVEDTLVLMVVKVLGTGTYSSWFLSITGVIGEQGLAGPAGADGMAGTTDDLTEGVTNLYFTTARARNEALLKIKNLTANHTVMSQDIVSTLLRFTNATPITLTLPLHTPEIPVGTCVLVSRSGEGDITIVGEEGVTLHSSSSFLMSKLNAKLTIIKVADNDWDLEGNLAAV